MNNVPKRSQEEGGHPNSSKHPVEDVNMYPKLNAGGSNEYHLPYEMVPDPRTTKPRELDRRSPLHSAYRVPSSSLNDLHTNPQLVASESRSDARDSKDNRDHRFDSRDLRTESRELHSEPRRETQGTKGEKDVRFDSDGDDGKEVKLDNEKHVDPKNDTKLEKDGFGSTSNQLIWKDSKEYHRGKKYSESPSGHVDPWFIPRGNPQGQVEIGKESLTNEEKDYGEAHEAVGENKLDSKSDDRFKDKDRKRKDVRHREWGDRDKERADRKSSNLQVVNSGNEGKEFNREEREIERWDRKDAPKDREKPKEREKDHVKKDSMSGVAKDGQHNEKEWGDGSTRISEQETTAMEQKKQKEIDGWKIADREPKARRKERVDETDGDRAEKRIGLDDKESDDGCADGEGTAKRERESFNHGVQQRKRMLRPRGSPQLANREPRFRSRSQDNEGSQGKPEVSSVVYKVGECMQDLIKLWKGYESSQPDKSGESATNGPTLEIRIPAELVTATNRQVRGAQLWGTDVYTNDSDLVAVLMHTGYCRPTASPPPPAIQELRAAIRVLPSQDSYTSMLRNNVRSRAWGGGIGCSYRVERCCIVKKGGGTIDLEPCLTHASTVEPTLAPVAVERTMTTRAAASNALRQQRFVREVTIQYNLCNEPWIKYSISIVADKGLKKLLYTSARLKKGEVLYLETHSRRYELCFMGEKMVKATPSAQAHEELEKSYGHHVHSSNGEKNDNDHVLIDAFRWSLCKKPLPQKFMQSLGVPLPLEYVEVLEENLDWEDVQWSQTGVWIVGKEYQLARVHFLSPN